MVPQNNSSLWVVLRMKGKSLTFQIHGIAPGNAYHLISETPSRVGDDRGGVWDEFGNSLSEDPEAQKLATVDGYFTEW